MAHLLITLKGPGIEICMGRITPELKARQKAIEGAEDPGQAWDTQRFERLGCGNPYRQLENPIHYNGLIAKDKTAALKLLADMQILIDDAPVKRDPAVACYHFIENTPLPDPDAPDMGVYVKSWDRMEFQHDLETATAFDMRKLEITFHWLQPYGWVLTTMDYDKDSSVEVRGFNEFGPEIFDALYKTGRD